MCNEPLLIPNMWYNNDINSPQNLLVVVLAQWVEPLPLGSNDQGSILTSATVCVEFTCFVFDPCMFPLDTLVFPTSRMWMLS